jgi:hypothetical protein
VDGHASNALRTLGIILTAILLFTGSAVLLLFSACFGIIASGTHGSDETQLTGLALGALIGAVVLIVLGGGVIAKLSRGMVRESSAAPLPGSPRLESAPEPAAGSSSALASAVDVAHLSPASRAAIHNLELAIGALIAADLLFSLAPVGAMLGHSFLLPMRFPAIPYAFIYRLVAAVPYIILLIAVRRSPSPRTFAYALAIPAIPVAWSILSAPIILFALFRVPGSLLPQLLWIVLPLLMDMLILYYAWIAIQRTGIHPPPKRLIIASAVVFAYRIFFTAISMGLIAMTTKILRG